MNELGARREIRESIIVRILQVLLGNRLAHLLIIITVTSSFIRFWSTFIGLKGKKTEEGNVFIQRNESYLAIVSQSGTSLTLSPTMTCDEIPCSPSSSSCSCQPSPAILRTSTFTTCPITRSCLRCSVDQEPCLRHSCKCTHSYTSWIGRSCSRLLVASHLITVILISSTISLTSGQLFTNDVINVEMFPRENAKAHRTSAYEITERPGNPSLVIRRGDPFYLAISLRQPYDPQRDKIRLEFMFGTL